MSQCATCGRTDCHCEPFTLAVEPAQGRKCIVFGDTDKQKQGKLFAGADCIAGQNQLFNPDGKEISDHV